MAEITVRAETNTLGMKVGDERSVEDSPFLRNVIRGGRLSLVESTCADTDTAASQPAPDGAVDAPAGRSAAKGKQRRTEGEAEAVEVLEPAAIRPPGDPDAILADALVTLTAPPPEAA